MTFPSIRNRIVTVAPRITLIKSALFAVSLMFTILTQAQWQDPLESPSLGYRLSDNEEKCQ